jgi:hypothetical protein
MPVRWGLLECGDMARKPVARALLDELHSQLLAAYRRDETKLCAFCQAFAIERAYTRDAGGQRQQSGGGRPPCHAARGCRTTQAPRCHLPCASAPRAHSSLGACIEGGDEGPPDPYS